METETIDKLYLELSQVTRATTAKEQKLEGMIAEANDLLRSAYQIAERDGREVNWEAWRNRLRGVLVKQHEHMFGTPPGAA